MMTQKTLSPFEIVLHILIMAFFWWILTGHDYQSWFVGVPAVLLSLWVRMHMTQSESWCVDVFKIFPFLLYFLIQSVSSGVDVIKRAFHPKLPLKPAFIRYPLKLKTDVSRVFFANVISLLPGTFSANFTDDTVEVHVLDESLPNERNLQALEVKIAEVFCEEISHG